jgi:hypothetical protein
MKKGFVFTLVFSLLFLMLLYTASAYIALLQARQAALDKDDPGREAYFADDVGYDYLSIWGMGTSLSRDSSKAYWTIRDRIPNRIGDLRGKVIEYQNFISGEYSRANNIRASAELDESGEILLEPNAVSYGHSSRSDIVVEGNALEYRITAKLSKSCAGGCISSGNWNWGSSGDGPYVFLDITDANGSRIDAFGRTSGYLRLNETNTLYIPLENAGAMELRLSSGYMKMEFSNAGAETTTTLGVDGSSPLKVYAPVKLTIGERTFQRIVLLEK